MLFSAMSFNELERFCYAERGHLEAEGELLLHMAEKIDAMEKELIEKREKLTKISDLAHCEDDDDA